MGEVKGRKEEKNEIHSCSPSPLAVIQTGGL